jgi:hypothetical protein
MIAYMRIVCEAFNSKRPTDATRLGTIVMVAKASSACCNPKIAARGKLLFVMNGGCVYLPQTHGQRVRSKALEGIGLGPEGIILSLSFSLASSRARAEMFAGMAKSQGAFKALLGV